MQCRVSDLVISDKTCGLAVAYRTHQVRNLIPDNGIAGQRADDPLSVGSNSESDCTSGDIGLLAPNSIIDDLIRAADDTVHTTASIRYSYGHLHLYFDMYDMD